MSGKQTKMLDVAAKTERDPASCWETPEWLVERIRAAFGGVIDLDPCTTAANPVGATRFLTPDDDGILQEWGPFRQDRATTIYINPPYGRTIRHWTEKALNVAAAHWTETRIILLVPARTDSAWWHDLAEQATAVLFIRGRIAFKNAGGSPKFPSALVGLNDDLAYLDNLGYRAREATA